MKTWLSPAVILGGVLMGTSLRAEEKPQPPAGKKAARAAAEARIQELEGKVKKLEAEMERLGKLAAAKEKPATPILTSPSGKDRESYVALSEAGKEKLRSEFSANRDRLMNASREERNAFFKETMEKIKAAETGKKVPIEEPPLPSWQSKPTTPTPRSGAGLDHGRFMNLPDEAREKFIEEMKSSRDKMINASPEERAAFARELFERVQKEAEAKKETPASPAAPASPEGKEPK